MVVRVILDKKVPIKRKFDFDDDLSDIKSECEIDESIAKKFQQFIKDDIKYSPSLYSKKHKFILCKIFEFKGKDDIDCEYTSEITCPWCGYIQQDSWERIDEGNDICSCCGSIFSYERFVTIDYCTDRIKKNDNIIEA